MLAGPVLERVALPRPRPRSGRAAFLVLIRATSCLLSLLVEHCSLNPFLRTSPAGRQPRRAGYSTTQISQSEACWLSGPWVKCLPMDIRAILSAYVS